MEIDISQLNFVELEALRVRVDSRMRELREEGVPELLEKLASEAATRGLTIDDLLRAAKRRKRPHDRRRREAGIDC